METLLIAAVWYVIIMGICNIEMLIEQIRILGLLIELAYDAIETRIIYPLANATNRVTGS